MTGGATRPYTLPRSVYGVARWHLELPASGIILDIPIVQNVAVSLPDEQIILINVTCFSSPIDY
jgi:hypothetical protein